MKDNNTQNDELLADDEETELFPAQAAGTEEETDDSDDFIFTEVEDEGDFGDADFIDFDDEEDDDESSLPDSWKLRCLAGQDNASAVEKLYIKGGLSAVRAMVDSPDEGLFYRYDAAGLEIAYFNGAAREASWKRLYSYTRMMYSLLLDAERGEYADLVQEAHINGWKNPETCARRLVCLAAELGSAPMFQENRRIEFGAFAEITAAVEEMETAYQAFREGSTSHE